MNQTAERAKKLFITNPMKMEVTRFRSRFFHPTESSTVNSTLLALVVLSYLVILAVVFAFRTDVHPGVVVMIQAILGLIAAPSAAHAVIAGEKDRRSWDLLQAAPITQGEIVVGKFMGVCGLVTGLMVAFLPMIAIAMISYPHLQGVTAYKLIIAELITLSSCFAAVAFTINLSARLKSATSALVASIASLTGALLILPMGLAVILDGVHTNSQIMDALLVWHPVYAIIRLLAGTNNSFLISGLDLWYGLPLVAFYLAITAFFLRTAEIALQKPKHE